ncbi:hypothetical protein [Clostridium aminobutyricum]|uniref:Glycoside hydrolase family 5 domain-containing protein n=1 Tax=Clostridium aminobutyricum TaxID=33953 RepID=A0A939D9L9_CLOAM|nr:hypothetical protein [Clostridium aminobutyricum]MBN7773253.1 hypothetical protein [Clostridium aminobutyricum]
MQKGLTFGIYPLSAAGTPAGLAVGPDDNYEKIQSAIKNLGGLKKLYPRVYLIYTKEWEAKMLSLAERYYSAGLLADLTLGCGDWTTHQETEIELQNWLEFIRKIVNRYGKYLTSLQITNEPNLSFMEGSKPYIMQALVEGVITAKKESRNQGIPLKIGFGSVPDGPVSVPHFWENLAEEGGEEFSNSVDFVGHNFYTDVFEDKPLSSAEITKFVEETLRDLRERNLPIVGIPDSISIRVTENGWPTGKNPFTNIERPYDRQSEVLELIIRTIYDLRNELNISHYELFGLRDADSREEDLFHQFGIMRDDYTPKPAYATFKKLIEELSC